MASILNTAGQNGLRVKAVGSGHSASKIHKTDGYLLEVEHLRRFNYDGKGPYGKLASNMIRGDHYPLMTSGVNAMVDGADPDDPQQRRLVETEAGITIH